MFVWVGWSLGQGRRKKRQKSSEDGRNGHMGQTWHVLSRHSLVGGQRSLFSLPPDLFMQVESSWGNQAANWLIGHSFCAVCALWRVEGTSWWARPRAEELVLFTSRGSAPLHFWGEITVYHLLLVRAVTALCHTLTWNFRGETWSKVDRKWISEQKVGGTSGFSALPGLAKRPECVQEDENVVNSVACIIAICLPSSKEPHGFNQSSSSKWPAWEFSSLIQEYTLRLGLVDSDSCV